MPQLKRAWSGIPQARHMAVAFTTLPRNENPFQELTTSAARGRVRSVDNIAKTHGMTSDEQRGHDPVLSYGKRTADVKRLDHNGNRRMRCPKQSRALSREPEPFTALSRLSIDSFEMTELKF